MSEFQSRDTRADEKNHVYNEYGAAKGLTFKDQERCVDQ